ncbi:hypothetical protein BH11MYX4_BH11MYX4_43960 [soil metagenome]
MHFRQFVLGGAGSAGLACVMAAAASCSTFSSSEPGADGGGPDADTADQLVVGVPQPEITLELPAQIVLVHDATTVVELKVTRRPPFEGAVTLTALNLPDGVGSEPIVVPPAATTAKLKLVVGKSVPQGALKGAELQAKTGTQVIDTEPLKGFVRGSAGEIDTTFGKDGVVALDGEHNAITMRADGSFWVLENSGGHVRMYTKDGTLDSSFATAGIYTVNSSQPVNALAWKAPYLHLGVGLPGDWRLTRMNPDGQLDTTYGVGGIYKRTHGSPSPLVGMAVGTGGEAALVGAFGTTAVTAFVTKTGSTSVTAQDAMGAVGASPPSIFTAAVISASRVVAVGGSHIFAMAAATHQPDPAFSPGGPIMVDAVATLSSIAEDKAGNYVVGGTEIATQALFVARVTPVGGLDKTFGTAGVFRTGLVTATSGGALALSGDKILQSGTVQDGNEYRCMVARYTADGKLDATFGAGGKSVPLINECYVGDLAIQPDGRIVAAGRKLLRFWP